jgi:hypothetical protein
MESDAIVITMQHFDLFQGPQSQDLKAQIQNSEASNIIVISPTFNWEN